MKLNSNTKKKRLYAIGGFFSMTQKKICRRELTLFAVVWQSALESKLSDATRHRKTRKRAACIKKVKSLTN